MADNQHTFVIDFTDDETGQKYNGQFTVKRLAIRDMSALGVRKSQLSGGMYCVKDDNGNPTGQGIDEETDWLNYMIAHLELALVQKPLWFKLDEITSVALVRTIYKEVTEFEKTFKSRGKAAREAAGSNGVRQENGGGAAPQAVSGNTPTAVVGQKVPTSLDA
jgi:hypothetical protein